MTSAFDPFPANNTATLSVPVDPAVSIGDASAYEGGGVTKTLIKFPVKLMAPSDHEVTVDYRIRTGSAGTSDIDDRMGKTGTVRFTPSARTGLTPVTKTVTVAIRPDTEWENDETFQVNISNPTGGIAIADGAGLGTIYDDDEVGGQRLGIGDVTLREGDVGVGKVSVMVTLSQPAASTVTAKVTTLASGSVAGVDFKPFVKTVTFKPGQQAKVVTLTLYADEVDDGNDRIFLALSDVVGATVERTGQGRVTTLGDE